MTKAFAKGKATALNDILSVADNFERASAAISAETDGERAVVEYYRDAYDTMMGCLESLGLTEVETVRKRAFIYPVVINISCSTGSRHAPTSASSYLAAVTVFVFTISATLHCYTRARSRIFFYSFGRPPSSFQGFLQFHSSLYQ